MMKSNSPDNSAIERVLRGFLEGSSTLEELKQALKGRIEIKFSMLESGSRETRYQSAHRKHYIPVKPSHLRAALERYLRQEISEMDLSDWAAILIMVEDYYPFGFTEDDPWPESEDSTWGILYKLSTPQVYEISEQTAHQYLERLNASG